MILGVQMVGVFFGLFILYISFLHYKRQEFTGREYGFWSFFSVIFILMSLFPTILDPVIETLDIARKMDLLIMLGFIFLIGTTFYIYSLVRRTQKNVEDIVKEIAFKRAKKK